MKYWVVQREVGNPMLGHRLVMSPKTGSILSESVSVRIICLIAADEYFSSFKDLNV